MDALKISQVGRRVPCSEDVPPRRNAGCYVGDIDLPAMPHVAFVRSPYAHALIKSIDMSQARELAGVAAVATAAEMAEFFTMLRMTLGFPTTELRPNLKLFLLTPHDCDGRNFPREAFTVLPFPSIA